jgi:hypothetical protein
LIHIGCEHYFSLGFLDTGPNRGRLSAMRNIKQRKILLGLYRSLDESFAVVRGFVVDDDDFPDIVLLSKILVYFV